MMNYYQYGTVVYINSETSTSSQQSVKSAFENTSGSVDLVSSISNAKNNYQTETGQTPEKLEPHNPLDINSQQASTPKLYIVLPKRAARDEATGNEFSITEVIDVKSLILVNGVGTDKIPTNLNSMFYLVRWSKSNIEAVKSLSSGRVFKGLSFQMYEDLGKDLRNTYKLAETDINEINKLHAMQGDLTAIETRTTT